MLQLKPAVPTRQLSNFTDKGRAVNVQKSKLRYRVKYYFTFNKLLFFMLL